MDFDYYTGAPAGDNYYQYNPTAFNFDMSAYSNLINEPLLPPNHSNLFSEYPPSYPSYPAAPDAPIGHPHMSVSSAQGGHMYPSVSDYPPSNGSYSWLNSPSSATMHPPTSLPAPPVPPMGSHSPHDDQRVQPQQEFVSSERYVGDDEFYMFPQGPMYDIPPGIPSTYTGSGHEIGESPSPPSLIKPPADPEDADEDYDPEMNSLSMKDLEEQLPEGVTEWDLLNRKIPDLNKLLKDLALNRDEQNQVKRIRRQYKNRGYAHTCRKKKDEKKTTMKEQKQILHMEINELKVDVDRLRLERDQYKRNYELMKQNKNASAQRMEPLQ